MIVLSLFDGMSCGQIALRQLGIKVDKYYASEVDKFAIAQTMLNFPDTIQLGDVCNIDAQHIRVRRLTPYRVRTATDCAGMVQMGVQQHPAVQNAGQRLDYRGDSTHLIISGLTGKAGGREQDEKLR